MASFSDSSQNHSILVNNILLVSNIVNNIIILVNTTSLHEICNLQEICTGNHNVFYSLVLYCVNCSLL